MASTEDFIRLGVDHLEVLSSVSFLTQETSDGVYILLTSSEIIREPYLSFVLETRWPSGRLLSEYRVSLDLPVYSDADQVENRIQQPLSNILDSPESIHEPGSILAESEAEQTNLSGQDVIETNDGSTLIRIARQIRPDETVSLQQTMIAIQSLNPEAFADGNINRLLIGQVLRVPTKDEISAFDAESAFAEVSRQNQAMVEVVPNLTPGRGDSGGNSATGRLSVIATDSDVIDSSSATALSAVQENTELDRRIAVLETELSVRQEEADRARISRESLEFRLADLDAQIEAAQELIRLQDIRLAQMKELLSLAEAAAEAAAAEQAAQEARRISDTQPPRPPLGNLAGLANNSITILGSLGLLVLFLVWVMLRRNRPEMMEGSGVLEQLVEFQADQARFPEETAVVSQASVDSKSDDAQLGIADSKKGPQNGELGEIVSVNLEDPAFPSFDQAEEYVNPEDIVKDVSNDDTELFSDELGAGLDELDMPFDLSEQATSSAVGGKGARVSVGSSIGATDSGADPKEEPDFEPGSLEDEEGLNDLDFFSGEEETRLGDVAKESHEAIDELSIISKYDESATKLELAYAYKKMGDIDGAREILSEVITEGNENQRIEAREAIAALLSTP
ncbi:MAG: FimV/HubP family polar landmark protein [Pseudomonadota bacterium]|nr:FimV/HubP family polar landmark protein [Pseudomonadota bacterium]